MSNGFGRSLRQGRIGDHPIHPMLVHIPVGLFVASLVFDIVFLAGGSPVLPAVAFYCIAVAWIGGIIAAVFGLVEISHIAHDTEPRRVATIHAVLNVALLVLYVPNFLIRSRDVAILPTSAFILSLLGIGVLSVSGYLGGKLVYAYGIGRHPELRPVGEEKPPVKRVA